MHLTIFNLDCSDDRHLISNDYAMKNGCVTNTPQHMDEYEILTVLQPLYNIVYAIN